MKHKLTATILSLLLLLAGFALLTAESCHVQNEAVTLLNIAGPAISEALAVIGNPSLGQKVGQEFTTLSAQVKAYKPGSPCQSIIQIANDITADLSPYAKGPYAKVIDVADIAIAAVEGGFSSCQAAQPSSPAAELPKASKPTAPAQPVTAAQWKAQWNAQIALHPELSQAKVK